LSGGSTIEQGALMDLRIGIPTFPMREPLVEHSAVRWL